MFVTTKGCLINLCADRRNIPHLESVFCEEGQQPAALGGHVRRLQALRGSMHMLGEQSAEYFLSW